mgnify:FL=1|jgi:hypothetical protein
MSKIEFDYYYGAEAEQFTFIRVPKVLFTDKEHFGSLSNEAKLMYGLLLERMSLSRKNNWIDDENRVYIIFLIEEIEKIMDVCHDKALNILKELDDVNGIGLVKKKRRGLGLPSILYVKNFIINESDSLRNEKQDNTDNSEHTSRGLKNGFLEVDKTDFKKSEISTSVNRKNRLQEVVKADTNNTEINNTELSYIENQSINQSAALKKIPTPPRLIDEIDRETVEQSVKKQIEYDSLITHPDEAVVSMVEEIKDLIVDVISGERNIFVEGKKISEEAARFAYRKLTSEHITDVLRNILNYSGKISRIDRFLTTALYNSAFTLTNQTFSGFEHDMGMKLI